jgi:MFS family permease
MKSVFKNFPESHPKTATKNHPQLPWSVRLRKHLKPQPHQQLVAYSMAQGFFGVAGFSGGRSALIVLFSVVFLDNLGFAIVLPYLYYYAQSMGASDLTYGLLLASYSLLSFIFTPLVARLSDRYGRRKILLVALAFSSLSYFIFGTAQALWLLFAARMLAGTTAATVPVAQAYVADVTTEKARLRYLGLLGAAAGIAFVIGPAIGGTLSSLFGYGVPSFFAAGLAFTNLISTYFRLPETPCEDQEAGRPTTVALDSLQKALRRKTMTLLLIIYFMFFMAFISLQTALPPWLQATFGFGSIQTGLIFFYVGGISAFTQAVLLPKLSQRTSRATLMLVGIAVFAGGFFVLGVLDNLPALLAISAVVAFGFGGQFVLLNTLISVNAPREAQGGTLGSAWALAALAQTLAPILATYAFTVGSSADFAGLPFFIAGGIAVATVPLMIAFRKTSKD